jgi:hypothetical protein
MQDLTLENAVEAGGWDARFAVALTETAAASYV